MAALKLPDAKAAAEQIVEGLRQALINVVVSASAATVSAKAQEALNAMKSAETLRDSIGRLIAAGAGTAPAGTPSPAPGPSTST